MCERTISLVKVNDSWYLAFLRGNLVLALGNSTLNASGGYWYKLRSFSLYATSSAKLCDMRLITIRPRPMCRRWTFDWHQFSTPMTLNDFERNFPEYIKQRNQSRTDRCTLIQRYTASELLASMTFHNDRSWNSPLVMRATDVTPIVWTLSTLPETRPLSPADSLDGHTWAVVDAQSPLQSTAQLGSSHCTGVLVVQMAFQVRVKPRSTKY